MSAPAASPVVVPARAEATLHCIPLRMLKGDLHCEALFLDFESACPNLQERARVRRFVIRADPRGDHWAWWSVKDQTFTHAAYFLGLLDHALRHDKIRGMRIIRVEEERRAGALCRVSLRLEPGQKDVS